MLTIKFLNNLTLKKCKIPCSATIMLNFIKVSIFQLSCDMMTEVISHDESHPQKLYGGKPHFPKKNPHKNSTKIVSFHKFLYHLSLIVIYLQYICTEVHISCRLRRVVLYSNIIIIKIVFQYLALWKML